MKPNTSPQNTTPEPEQRRQDTFNRDVARQLLHRPHYGGNLHFAAQAMQQAREAGKQGDIDAELKHYGEATELQSEATAHMLSRVENTSAIVHGNHLRGVATDEQIMDGMHLLAIEEDQMRNQRVHAARHSSDRQ